MPGAFENKDTQRLVDNNTFRTEIPRYVNVVFEPSSLVAFGTLSHENSETSSDLVTNEDFGVGLRNIAEEDVITNESYTAFRENDPNGKNRLGKKIQELSKSLGLTFEDSDQSLKLSDQLGVQRSLIQELISPYNDKKTLIVNKSVKEEQFYSV